MVRLECCSFKNSVIKRAEQSKVERDSLGGWIRTNRSSDGLTTVSTESADGSLSVTHPDGSKLAVVQAADPRFGMQAPYASSSKLTTPAGLTLQTSTTRTTLLNDATDVLSLKTLLDSTVINGKTYQSAYDALTKTRCLSR